MNTLSIPLTHLQPPRWGFRQFFSLALALGIIATPEPTYADNWQPQLTVISVDSNGAVEFEIMGPQHSGCLLQSSTSFIEWQTVTNLTLRENYLNLAVPADTTAGYKFYRVIPTEDPAAPADSINQSVAYEQQAGIDPTIAKSIYGNDDRRDLFQESDHLRREAAAAVCGLVYTEELRDLGNGNVQLLTAPFEIGGLPPCSDERFAQQPTGPYCTAFLVGPDLVATAGHCYDSEDITQTSFIFGFQMTDAVTPARVFPAEMVYRGVAIVGREETDTRDYCIIRLDRAVSAPGIKPLRLRRTGVLGIGTQVGVIGHPSGLPLKLAFGPKTRVSSQETDFFRANLDTYGGNSGSPVLNATEGIVEGILVRGENDFLIGATGDCFRSERFPDNPGLEEVTKSSLFATLVPDWNGAVNVVWVDFGYAGPESGTESKPFRTSLKAAMAVSEPGTIRFKPGTIVERLRISKNIRLEAPGGHVRVGI